VSLVHGCASKSTKTNKSECPFLQMAEAHRKDGSYSEEWS